MAQYYTRRFHMVSTQCATLFQDLDEIMAEMRAVQTIEDAEALMLKHGENIVDSLGAEVDRIEKKLRQSHPELRHVDLEVL